MKCTGGLRHYYPDNRVAINGAIDRALDEYFSYSINDLATIESLVSVRSLKSSNFDHWEQFSSWIEHKLINQDEVGSFDCSRFNDNNVCHVVQTTTDQSETGTP
ncbi:hypothetical protein M0804_001526 [Polistes exclamans]|nr:hypothetical protein M0804_001526 [Polistes exclamans]